MYYYNSVILLFIIYRPRSVNSVDVKSYKFFRAENTCAGQTRANKNIYWISLNNENEIKIPNVSK